MSDQQAGPPSDAGSHRTQIAVAVIAAMAAIITAVVTSGFGLLSSGDPVPKVGRADVSANGGSSRNTGGCVSGGVVVQGTVNCASSGNKPRASRLRHSIEVRNGHTQAEPDDQGRLRYTSGTQPTIYVSLRNDGAIGAAVDRAQLILQGQAAVDACDPIGGGERIEPWPLGVTIPETLTVGAVLTTDEPFAYNIPADDATRIAVRLKLSDALFRGDNRLYRFKLRLRQVSGSSWIDAGEVGVLLPRVWGPNFDDTGSLATAENELRDTYLACTATNRRTLRRLMRGRVELSSELRSLWQLPH